MRQLFLAAFAFTVCFSQTSTIEVGQGASTETIRNEFQVAYQRDAFFATIALPPLTEVAAYGTGGLRQEFQDPAKLGLRSALIRPALPDLTQGLSLAVRQVRIPIYAVYTQSGVGSSMAGFPNSDTQRFSSLSPALINAQVAGSYQTFDKNFAIFVWDTAPLATETKFTIADPVFSRWAALGLSGIGPPLTNSIAVTSRFTTKASYQSFENGAIYAINATKAIYLRKAVDDLYQRNQGAVGFLGLPLSEELVLADGRRRQTFEGGTIEAAADGAPLVKNALTSVAIAPADPLRLTAGQTVSLAATLQTAAGEIVTDRDVFWSSSNGKVALVTGSGPAVSLRAIAGGSALITATSEGKTSKSLSVMVASQCCAVGEGAPSQAISQTFVDAIQRNRAVIAMPLSSVVRRVGGGYLQEALLTPSGARVAIAKADASPVAYLLAGPLLSAIDARGGVAGPLGYPLGDASAAGVQVFERGVLAGSPVRSVTGAILARWLVLGRDSGLLGLPLADVSAAATFTGASVEFQAFRGGTVYIYMVNGKAILISGPIAAKFAELGAAAGPLGAPLGDEVRSGVLIRQEFEGAFLEYSAGGAVAVVDKQRKPALTVTPSSLLPGARYRVAIGGFAAGARLRVVQGSAVKPDAFEAVALNGSYVWESIVPADARPGAVLLRATDIAAEQSFAEGAYTVRTIAELKPALAILSGDSQSGAPLSLLALPLRVVLRDSSGNPLAGVPLRFEASPGAALAGVSALTDSNGVAEARLRLSRQPGIAIVTVEAASSIVSFGARVASQTISDFPRISQAVDGTLGNSTVTLRDGGALVAALAGVVRFYQQRGLVPFDNGLADTVTLNRYLRDFNGYFDPGPGAGLQPNLLRVINFASGLVDLSFESPAENSIRDLVAAATPVIVALQMTRNGEAAGSHFVVAYGVNSSGDLEIADPNPLRGFSTLSQYSGGFAAEGAVWTAKPVAAIVFRPGGAPSSIFYVAGTGGLNVTSSGAPCSTVAAWPAGISDSAFFQSQICDGSAAAYRLSVTGGATFLSGLGAGVSRSLVAGAYRIGRSGDGWDLGPEQLSLNAEGIVNAASFSPRIGAGAIVTLFGTGLPADGGVDLSGVALPILFSNGFQLNTAIPPNTAPGWHSLRIRSSSGDVTIPIEIERSAPGLFVIASPSPALRGQPIVLYATGLGAVARQSGGLDTVVELVTVSIDGREFTSSFAGLAPGYIGLYQVNLNLDATVAPGIDRAITIRVGGIESNAGLLYIR